MPATEEEFCQATPSETSPVKDKHLPQWNNHHHLPASLAVEGESGNRQGPRTVLWTKDFSMTIS